DPAGPTGPAAPLYPTFADAARTAHITDAVLASAANRSWIEVS
ncbi:MAG: gfo/Idh/MocA family oxidoreductase, partial [Catenulispora sp.]|nr:gfo/Idh/MocA family oxidoreductase [Catenulispora sp.]